MCDNSDPEARANPPPMNDIATTAAARDRFCTLLRELFQFEHSAGLDFGIYRIMNRKREAVEQFINKDLADEIDQSAHAAVRGARAERLAMLESRTEKIKEAFGKSALDADGELDEKYHDTPLGEDYRKAQKGAASILDEKEIEKSAFNHLHDFFSRYYEGGDFISKRRYSRRQRYAIPYNGEEVHLHWANRDQYYIKTGEYFLHYSFQCGDYRVRLEVRDADVEQDNRKGKQRFFIPLAKKAHCDGKEVVVPFVFRPLDDSEKARFGDGNGKQEEILKAALPDIVKKLDAPAKVALLAAAEGGGDETTVLEKHMRRYARRNTADYFIHKDLRGFLSRELDFYIKNEVLNLDDLDQAGEFAAEGRFHLMRIVRAIGAKIIDFLTQIENFQKQLFEKKKFVIDTHYCVAAGRIADKLLCEEILTNNKQWSEWSAMAGEKINSAKARRDFLRDNPTLMVDTAHFDAEFKDRLLARFADIDGECDGVLLCGENFQGLNLLTEKYRGQVKCVYIDPPYNTGGDGFIYKDNYQHSCWMSMMSDRIKMGKSLLLRDGNFIVHVDEHEFENLSRILSLSFGPSVLEPIVWDKQNPKGDSTGIATQHEYVFWAVRDSQVLTKESLIRKKENAEQIIKKAQQIVRTHGVNDKARDMFKQWIKKNHRLAKGERAYGCLDDNGEVYSSVSMAWPNKKPAADDYFVPLKHPVTGKNCPVPERGWRSPSATMRELVEKGEILFGPDETTQPRRKYLLKENLYDNAPSMYYYGGSDDMFFKNIGVDSKDSTPKPYKVAGYLLGIGARNKDALVVDYFAGSGTTGHAVINLNRQDGGRRKFILMEMGEYFDSVLLPRLKRIAWTPVWEDGKPKRPATEKETVRAPRMFKYHRLESYEDALENIDFIDENIAQYMMKFPDYLLGYMLKWETRESQTLLNIRSLEAPFRYELRVRRNGDHRNTPVDVPETFNYLLGLQVKTRKIYMDGERRYLIYTGQVNNRMTAVIWRETEGWKVADFERERDFIAREKLTAGMDVVYLNQDSLVPGAGSLEGVFKDRLLGASEE